jgi:hypothetical protein
VGLLALITARQQLNGEELRDASVPDLVSFVEAFENELRKIDLSKLSHWDDLSPWQVAAMKEKPSDFPSDKGMILPDGSVHTFQPAAATAQISQLSDRIQKLEKGGK